MTLLDGLVLSGFFATAFQWRGVLRALPPVVRHQLPPARRRRRPDNARGPIPASILLLHRARALRNRTHAGRLRRRECPLLRQAVLLHSIPSSHSGRRATAHVF